jgi:hypothetical protein
MRRMYYKPTDCLNDKVGGDMDKGLLTSAVENDEDDNDQDGDEVKDADTEEDVNMDVPAILDLDHIICSSSLGIKTVSGHVSSTSSQGSMKTLDYTVRLELHLLFLIVFSPSIIGGYLDSRNSQILVCIHNKGLIMKSCQSYRIFWAFAVDTSKYVERLRSR